MPATKVLIATPTHDERVWVPYFTSVLKLLAAFSHRPDVAFDVVLPGSSLIIEARNVLATRVIEDDSFTHLLFIDSDMGFRPELVAKMLAFGEPYVGCFYPKRHTDYGRLIRVARERPDATKIREIAQAYVGEPWRGPDGAGVRRGDFLRAETVGTGVLLLRREVLERMRHGLPDLWLDRAPADVAARFGLKGGLFQGFYPLRRPDGAYLGEDISFCRRWTESLGGEVWACTTEAITHNGHETFVGEYAAHLPSLVAASKTPQPPEGTH